METIITKRIKACSVSGDDAWRTLWFSTVNSRPCSQATPVMFSAVDTYKHAAYPPWRGVAARKNKETCPGERSLPECLIKKDCRLNFILVKKNAGTTTKKKMATAKLMTNEDTSPSCLGFFLLLKARYPPRTSDIESRSASFQIKVIVPGQTSIRVSYNVWSGEYYSRSWKTFACLVFLLLQAIFIAVTHHNAFNKSLSTGYIFRFLVWLCIFITHPISIN